MSLRPMKNKKSLFLLLLLFAPSHNNRKKRGGRGDTDAPLLKRSEAHARCAVVRVSIVRISRSKFGTGEARKKVVRSQEELDEALDEVALSLGVHDFFLLRVEEHLKHHGGPVGGAACWSCIIKKKGDIPLVRAWGDRGVKGMDGYDHGRVRRRARARRQDE